MRSHLLSTGAASQARRRGAGGAVIPVLIRRRILRVLELDPHYDAPVPLPALLTQARTSVGYGIGITVGHADATAYVCIKPIYCCVYTVGRAGACVLHIYYI